VLLPVGHLAGHYLLLQLAVDLLIDQNEAAAGGREDNTRLNSAAATRGG
jgi:hypothetical protein